MGREIFTSAIITHGSSTGLQNQVSGVRASRPVQKRLKMKKLKLLTNIEESYDELRYKTSWPTKKQLIKSAIIVMIASIIIALIIFVMDQIVDNLMHLIYSLHG